MAADLPKREEGPARTDQPKHGSEVVQVARSSWERANVKAGRKCVRGVVDTSELLTTNPWKNFTWIDGIKRLARQFTPDELVSILNYFESHWQGVTVATAAVKVCLWSWSRLSEFTRLRWDDVRIVGDEVHVEIIGKWAVRKWARIPSEVYRDVLRLRTESPYVFRTTTSSYAASTSLPGGQNREKSAARV